MSRGAVFRGLAEGPITFMPTYKFEKGRESSGAQPYYDMGEKKRVPAWTDRVFFRGSRAQRDAKYTQQLATARLQVPYYAKSARDLDTKYGGPGTHARTALERQARGCFPGGDAGPRG